MSAGDSAPRAALWLGWAGVIPFALLTGALAFGLDLGPVEAGFALRAYGAAILSFLGGAQWGVLLPRPQDSSLVWRYGVSVLPSLLAFLCLLAPHTLGLVGLAAGLAGLLAYDLSTVRAGIAPRWFGWLRLQLTAAVVALLTIAALVPAR